MKPYIVYKTHNIEKNEKYDFFIYAPHSWISKNWLKEIKNHLYENNFSDNVLIQYILHEADLWAREISLWIYNYLKEKFKNLKLCLILWEVPRWFCDFNRIIENACPSILKDNYFLDIYNKSTKEIEDLILNSNYWLHLHTMCWKCNNLSFVFDKNTKNEDIVYFLENSYSWIDRNDTILTSNKIWEYFSFKELDDVIKKHLNLNNIIFDENESYSFEKRFVVTSLIQKTPASFIEVLKSNISTDETKNYTNNSKIILDKNKINFYVELLSKSIEEFLNNKY
jgi:hypothetical protein